MPEYDDRCTWVLIGDTSKIDPGNVMKHSSHSQLMYEAAAVPSLTVVHLRLRCGRSRAAVMQHQATRFAQVAQRNAPCSFPGESSVISIMWRAPA